MAFTLIFYILYQAIYLKRISILFEPNSILFPYTIKIENLKKYQL